MMLLQSVAVQGGLTNSKICLVTYARRFVDYSWIMCNNYIPEIHTKLKLNSCVK